MLSKVSVDNEFMLYFQYISTGPHFSGNIFLVVTLQNNRHTYVRAQQMFPIRNIRSLSIREAPRQGGAGVFPTALPLVPRWETSIPQTP